MSKRFLISGLIFLCFSFAGMSQQKDFIHLGGQVFAGSFPLDRGIAVLFEWDGQDYFAIDTIEFDTLGYYSFPFISAGSYIVQVKPHPYSLSYGQHVPTYYGNTIEWVSATGLNLNQSQLNADIHLEKKNLTNGYSEISGTVFYTGTNIPIPDANVFLKNNIGELVNMVVSDSNGNYLLGLLETGTYEVFAERGGYTNQKTNVFLSQDSIFIFGIDLYLSAPQGTGIHETESSIISFFPNPVSQDLYLKGIREDCVFRIFSMDGKETFNYRLNALNIDDKQHLFLPELTPGLYIFTLSKGEKVFYSEKIQIVCH